MNRSRARTKRLLEGYNDLLNEYNKLVRRWNRYVKSLATGPAIGRLPRATQAQQAQVRKLRKAGHTLREIVLRNRPVATDTSDHRWPASDWPAAAGQRGAASAGENVTRGRQDGPADRSRDQTLVPD